MARIKTMYVCSECGQKAMKWQGKCPSCDSWNTLQENEVVVSTSSKTRNTTIKSTAKKLKDVEYSDNNRYKTGIEELDRVLGGGFVNGSVVLLGGDPGIGKSTLLIECCEKMQKLGKQVLYVTGEESCHQIKLRANRLQLDCDDIILLSENDVLSVIDAMQGKDFVVIDSIQTMTHSDVASAMGSVTQIRECSSALIKKAKNDDICMILIGHVTKDGNIAGPKVLEHMVDTVLYFEGERHQMLRVLRTQKNRFGSTNEVGVFEMTGQGIKEVRNPSEMFLGDMWQKSGGCAVCCVMEGTRPILIEVQALLTNTVYGQPRRMSSGIDYNRLSLLLAVLEKKLRLPTGKMDCYVNVVGGMNINTPETDLGVVMAIISSIRDKSINDKIAFIGEVGLTGEIRFVSNLEKRINECKKMGIEKIVVPKCCVKNLQDTKGIFGCSTLIEAIKNTFNKEEQN